ncbi:hypothetical protein A2U01_0083329, partial [Trifolium medium]|nr:hypothetical protein [Trifolium medium]
MLRRQLARCAVENSNQWFCNGHLRVAQGCVARCASTGNNNLCI